MHIFVLFMWLERYMTFSLSLLLIDIPRIQQYLVHLCCIYRGMGELSRGMPHPSPLNHSIIPNMCTSSQCKKDGLTEETVCNVESTVGVFQWAKSKVLTHEWCLWHNDKCSELNNCPELCLPAKTPTEDHLVQSTRRKHLITVCFSLEDTLWQQLQWTWRSWPPRMAEFRHCGSSTCSTSIINVRVSTKVIQYMALS